MAGREGAHRRPPQYSEEPQTTLLETAPSASPLNAPQKHWGALAPLAPDSSESNSSPSLGRSCPRRRIVSTPHVLLPSSPLMLALAEA